MKRERLRAAREISRREERMASAIRSKESEEEVAEWKKEGLREKARAEEEIMDTRAAERGRPIA